VPIDTDYLQSQLPKSAFAFFIVFSRFECSLKRAGYLEPQEEAKVDWNRFTKDLGPTFFESLQASGKVETLIKAPPMKQIVGSGGLDWKPAQNPKNVADIFVLVRRVRNNLFHGGKYPSGVKDEDSRNERLLDECLWVLNKALESCDGARKVFEQPLS
jgi:hypothetical protein